MTVFHKKIKLNFYQMLLIKCSLSIFFFRGERNLNLVNPSYYLTDGLGYLII